MTHQKKVSRPMSETASGLDPGSGAGAWIRNLPKQRWREERIFTRKFWSETLNSGGQRNGGDDDGTPNLRKRYKNASPMR